MYARIDAFGIDKAVSPVIEEAGIAEAYIREYYRRKGLRVWKVEKNLGDYRQQRLYDLTDNLGCRWEVKHDCLWHITGNVYIEIQALEASEADKYLVFAGIAFVIAKSVLIEAIAPYLGAEREDNTRGGDNDRSLGVKLPVGWLEEFAEEVIAL